MLTKAVLLSTSASQCRAFHPLRPLTAATRTEIVAALSRSEKATLWICGSSRMTSLLLSSWDWSRGRMGRALLLSKPTPETLITLSECFERIAVVDVTLPMAELVEAVAAPNCADLFVGGLVDHNSQVITLLRGDFETLAVPFSAFPVSGDGIIPDFTNFGLTDSGQTVRLGRYEAATDAILEEFSATFRQRRRKGQRAVSRSRKVSRRRPILAVNSLKNL